MDDYDEEMEPNVHLLPSVVIDLPSPRQESSTHTPGFAQWQMEDLQHYAEVKKVEHSGSR